MAKDRDFQIKQTETWIALFTDTRDFLAAKRGPYPPKIRQALISAYESIMETLADELRDLESKE